MQTHFLTDSLQWQCQGVSGGAEECRPWLIARHSSRGRSLILHNSNQDYSVKIISNAAAVCDMFQFLLVYLTP